MTYTISYDRITKIVTPFALLAQVAAIIVFVYLSFENKVGIAMPLMLIFFIAVLFFSIAFAPKSYQIIDGQLYINRLMMPPL